MEKNGAFRDWFKECTEVKRKAYEEAKRKAARVVKEEKRNWMEKWTRQLEEDVRGNRSILYKLIRGRRRGQSEMTRPVERRAAWIQGWEINNRSDICSAPAVGEDV